VNKVAILTPEPSPETDGMRWRAVFAELKAALETAGLEAEARPWTEPGDLSGFALVLPLLVWGYHHAGARWQDAVAAWESAGVTLMNAPSVLRWNAEKTYLAAFAERGAPVVPTLFAERLDERVMDEARERFGTDRLIAKPQVSAGAWQTIRWSPGMALDGGPTGPAMIQPYLPSIEREGEVSLLYFSGAFSHAISKVPQPGDFRVQPEYDGIIAAYRPRPDELDAADAVLRAAGEPLLYARIDLVRGLDGRPQLMELEAVEPDLFLRFDDAAPAAFAGAVKAAASGRGSR
jgi:glutathione synthase/RimK-type ligase-like ATP-grasp enzyme